MEQASTRLARRQRALITGGAGFVGSHLAEALLERGYDVAVIDNLSTGRFANIQPLTERFPGNDGAPRFTFAIDTIDNDMVLDRLASESDVIFHLAAAVGVKLIVENPVHTIETNIVGTDRVLRAAMRYRAKVILTSTSEVYGKGVHIPFREGDDVVLGPTHRNRWGYAASKMIDEFLALAYYEEKQLPVAVIRLFNTVGPRQSSQYGMVIPRLVEQALRGDPLTVYGDGEQSRCFLHVYDAVAAFVALAECPEAVGQVFNAGSTEEVSIKQLARKILHAVDAHHGNGVPLRAEERIQLVPYEQAYSASFEDMMRRVPDITKIRTYTGWQPRYSLDTIIDDVIASSTAHAVANV
jgi:UDP-glucose 4-epimerase